MKIYLLRLLFLVSFNMFVGWVVSPYPHWFGYLAILVLSFLAVWFTPDFDKR